MPVRPPSKYSWNPFSLFSGLAAAALPLLSPPAWKVCTVVAVRQLHLGMLEQNAGTSVAISLDDFLRGDASLAHDGDQDHSRGHPGGLAGPGEAAPIIPLP